MFDGTAGIFLGRKAGEIQTAISNETALEISGRSLHRFSVIITARTIVVIP